MSNPNFSQSLTELLNDKSRPIYLVSGVDGRVSLPRNSTWDFKLANANVILPDGLIAPPVDDNIAYREVTGSTTLQEDDGFLDVTATNPVIVTLPLATTLAATVPPNTVKKYHFRRPRINSVLAVTLSGSDYFDKLQPWNSHYVESLNDSDGRFVILFVNSPVPYWTFETPVHYHCIARSATVNISIDNNFGVLPPQSDASQLWTSTNRADHENGLNLVEKAWTFTQKSTNADAYFQIINPGIQCILPGRYRFSYRVDILFPTTTGFATYHRLRTDLINSANGGIVPGSYAEVTGTNNLSSGKVIFVETNYTFFTGVNPGVFNLRMTQQAGNEFTSNASISNVWLRIDYSR